MQTACVNCGNGTFSLDGVSCEVCPAGTEPPQTHLELPAVAAEDVGPADCVMCPAAKYKMGTAVSDFVPHGTHRVDRKPRGVARYASDDPDRGYPSKFPEFLSGNWEECIDCDGGWEPSFNHSECVHCRPGRAGVNGTCDLCPDGYRPNALPQSCTVGNSASGFTRHPSAALPAVQCPPRAAATDLHPTDTTAASAVRSDLGLTGLLYGDDRRDLRVRVRPRLLCRPDSPLWARGAPPLLLRRSAPGYTFYRPVFPCLPRAPCKGTLLPRHPTPVLTRPLRAGIRGRVLFAERLHRGPRDRELRIDLRRLARRQLHLRVRRRLHGDRHMAATLFMRPSQEDP